MTHQSSHVIIHRIRTFIASWPLAAVGGTNTLSIVVSWLI